MLLVCKNTCLNLRWPKMRIRRHMTIQQVVLLRLSVTWFVHLVHDFLCLAGPWLVLLSWSVCSLIQFVFDLVGRICQRLGWFGSLQFVVFIWLAVWLPQFVCDLVDPVCPWLCWPIWSATWLVESVRDSVDIVIPWLGWPIWSVAWLT